MTELAESLRKCRIEGNILYLPPIEEGPLTNYQDVRKALLNAGAKYKRNTFVFSSDAQPFIDRLCGGESVNIKKEFQFFPTPDDIADYMVELLDIQDDDTILEPEAGQAALVNAVFRENPFITVYGYELMPENQKVLEYVEGFELLGSDFLEATVDRKYSKIIANPPFSKNQDIDHIMKMWDFLEEKGRIVTVASKHWEHSSNKKETQFRDWLSNTDHEKISLESGRFKESGTMISTQILVIDKK